MRISMIGRHAKEGIKNLIRNGWMTFASVSAVTITLLILGVTLVIALNAQEMSTYTTSQLEISVYMDMSVTDAQAQQIAAEVRQLPEVQSVQYISKEQGFQKMQNEIGSQYGNVLQGLSGNSNPLPDALVVKAKDPKNTVLLSQQIRSLPGVADVKSGSEYISKLFTFLDAVRTIGLAFVVGLVVMAMFLISNTIKITIFSRRREIEIMKLVGATNWFIRWPFLMEGITIGILGALVPYVVIIGTYRLLFVRASGSFVGMAFSLVPVMTLADKMAVVLFGLGIFIGIWGGIMSIRKFLHV